MNVIQTKCKYEPLSRKGTKLMEFTEGKTYVFLEVEEGLFKTKDDNGCSCSFWDLSQMFEKI